MTAFIQALEKLLLSIPPWASGAGFLAICLSVAIYLVKRSGAFSNLWRVYAQRKPALPVHAICPHAPEVREQTSLHGQWTRIQGCWHDRYIKDCMANGKAALKVISLQMKDAYRKALFTHKEVCETALNHDYDDFCALLVRWCLEMEEAFEARIEENGFLRMPREFYEREYRPDKVLHMMSAASELFDIFHKSSFVNRGTLRDVIIAGVPDLKALIGACFDFARARSYHYWQLRRGAYDAWSNAHAHCYGHLPAEKFDGDEPVEGF